MTETNILTLHAHVDRASSDCDGPLYSEYVIGLSDEERAEHVAADGVNDFSEIRFRERVLLTQVSVYGDFEAGHAVVRITEDGFNFHQPTDEGYRGVEVRWCDDEDCDPFASSQRDIYAEMMGY